MANAVAARESGPPVPAPNRGSWRGHIVRQLRLRDTEQRERFRDVIRFYTELLDRTGLTPVRASSSARCQSVRSSASSLLAQKQHLRKATGELAFQVVQMQQSLGARERYLEEQRGRYLAPLMSPPPITLSPYLSPSPLPAPTPRLQLQQSQLASASASRLQLRRRVELLQQVNWTLKSQYDVLLEGRRRTERELQRETLKQARLDRVMVPGPPAAAPTNGRDQPPPRARPVPDTPRGPPAVPGDETDPRPVSSPGREPEQEPPSLVRSSSARSTRILGSIKDLFRKRRGGSVSSLDQDLWRPMRGGLATVPARALHVLEAHEQGINAVQFCSGSDTVATGGTDRVVKLWEVSAGWLTHRLTLEGSTDGITCVEFDPTGLRVLAASYDKSALLWRVDDSAPKLTLTGHSRKVTSARFRSLHQVATGSADGTVRLWDLQRAACVQLADAASFCSDLRCCDSSVISGHFDGRARVWDPRVSSVVQQFPDLGKVTSLDVTPDQRRLLSCCRDDCLQLTDLRMQTRGPVCYRADGFSCGSDCTRAVLSPDGRLVAAGSADGAVYVWDVSSGRLEARLPDRHRSAVIAASWSVSGEYVVSVDKWRQAVLWSS